MHPCVQSQKFGLKLVIFAYPKLDATQRNVRSSLNIVNQPLDVVESNTFPRMFWPDSLCQPEHNILSISAMSDALQLVRSYIISNVAVSLYGV